MTKAQIQELSKLAKKVAASGKKNKSQFVAYHY